ncbi:ribosomal RNA small subunit methyltransferase NEP1-like [Hibiscus syriacus]|uniref:Conserved oligomeric Golgi complex subunit 7 n=1 Tax=Hibiscus syriacus TaxID=106335 RepID=A0A6A3BYV9_HIBSY|nr:ribosomal RNA small subunit methyltransferase NEP1-like [Hibiscus syriacus]
MMRTEEIMNYIKNLVPNEAPNGLRRDRRFAQEQSSSAILRVPRATCDILRLQDDAVSLRNSVVGILNKLKKAEGSSAESISALANVDTVKHRMEAAYETLQDAAGLTQLSATVEDVFASGDLPRAAETLANMRHCLSSVGEVAEFANIWKQLEVLEDRLDTMVQPRLTDALSNRKVDVAQDLRGILVRIGRFESLELHYTKVHLKPIKQLWDDFDSKRRVSKLANEKSEAERPAINNASQSSSLATLVPKLLTETMAAVGSSFVSRINIAPGEVVHETKAFAKGFSLLSGGRCGQPFYHVRTHGAGYLLLSSEIAGVDLKGAVSRSVGAQGNELSETVRRIEESIPQVIVLLEAVVERWISFTGGSEADELILALYDIMLQYISTLQVTLKSLRAVCGADHKDISLDKKEGAQNSRKADLISNEEEWSIVQGALQILTVADRLTSRSSVFEASLRAALARLSTSFSLAAFAVRLVDVPEKSRKLLNLLDQSKDPRFHALPSQRVAAFAESVNELVYDVLISKVQQRLSDVSCMPIWSAAEEKALFIYQPLVHILSPTDANNDETQFFATEWMFKVAEGATALYMEQLRGIQYITDRGAQQLSVDIEYLSNVLSALSVPIPLVLATFQTCPGTPRDQLKDLLKSDNGNQLDLPTANLVCKIRRLNLD